MSDSTAPIREWDGPLDAAGFARMREAGVPTVMRGLVADWPAVAAARTGDRAIADYLIRQGGGAAVSAIAAAPEEKGRFFYTPDLTQLNFVRGRGRLDAFLNDLLRAADHGDPPAMAVQSEHIREIMPAFAQENRLDILPGVDPRIWIGNRIRVAAHYDVKENVACCVAGRRRFTLFPPDQLRNLYPGPLELTPAGTPVSLVDLENPDFKTHPRFAEALPHAQQATLEPGDALFIPYCWWHGVQSLEPVSILVNYWWTEGVPQGNGGHYDALLHAILAFKHLPPAQKAVWQDMLDYFVFAEDGGSKHLPAHAKGVLGPASPQLFDTMRAMIRGALGGPGAPR